MRIQIIVQSGECDVQEYYLFRRPGGGYDLQLVLFHSLTYSNLNSYRCKKQVQHEIYHFLENKVKNLRLRGQQDSILVPEWNNSLSRFQKYSKEFGMDGMADELKQIIYYTGNGENDI